MFFDAKKKNQGAAILLAHQGADGKIKDTLEDDKPSDDDDLSAIAEDLISAIHAKDVKGVKEALHAFLMCVPDEGSGEDEAPAAP